MTSQLLWTLIAVQIFMGGFDAVYHHELMERLAWRPSQRHELALHAARNFLYAVLFGTLGLAEPHGLLAMVLIAVLAAEVVITLLDFVEEDMSRKLPVSERVLHTLLALNYGAILALLTPVLVGWARLETGIRPVSYGVWSALAVFTAVGVILFGLRDLFASRRSGRLKLAPAADLASALPRRHAILVTGATGFIGGRLVEALATAGHEVIVLARNPAKAALLRAPFRLVTSLDQVANDTRVDAIVNLAGEPIANGLWTPAKRHRILASRLRMTADVVRLIARLERRPAVLVSGSAVGWYGPRGDERLTESAEAVPCFGYDVCRDWERAARQAEQHGVRVVRLRIGLVLGVEGGVLSQMLTPFWFGLGGPFGSGRQWMPWIERDDLVRLILHAIATPGLAGPVNATAPEPVRNETFAHELGLALHRPAVMRVPAFILRLGGDLAKELLLSGHCVLPAKAEASGFRFRHRTLRSALGGILGSKEAGMGEDVSARSNAADLPAALVKR